MPKHLIETGNQSISGNLIASGGIYTGYTEATTDYTALSTDSTIDCLSTATIQLPTAIGLRGRVINIKNSSTGTVLVSAWQNQKIDATNYALLNTQWSNLQIQATSSGNWIIL